jgi:asparagine synthase (glutamine-hydrolysing)
MCGIAGKIYLDGQGAVDPDLVDRMMAAITHRGPDGSGKYLSPPVGLGHTRLAIIDLKTGDQPMTNETGSIWLTYNGEIYNYKELRKELLDRGHVFHSTSDTEVIIHAYEEYGPRCVERFRGMFAFALWDKEKQILFLGRDRVGIKPLYYVNTGRAILFASELKSLLCAGELEREVEPEAVHRFLTFLYLPGDMTLLKGIRKLEPGHYLIVKQNQVSIHQYWDLQFSRGSDAENFQEKCVELEQLVRRTVKDYIISDVPVGVLLSGGVDSTVVLSCAVAETTKRISTFTIGFGGQEFDDERPFAKMAATRFGTDHHEITISPDDFAGFLPTYVRHMEEPVCEAPAIALHFVAKLARERVKVVLSGEGGDEAFGGYQTYRNLVMLERLKKTAGPFKNLLSAGMARMGGINGFHRFRKYAPLFKTPLTAYYFSRVSTPFSYFNSRREELCTREFLHGINGNNEELIAGLFRRIDGQTANQPELNRMLYVDTKTWLPDDLLIKADKMTMANSLELRVPLLDHPVLEFAAGLPSSFKVKGLVTKRILKGAFKDRIPHEIIRRRKTGLPVPLERWMRDDLRDYVDEILLDDRSLNRQYFHKSGIERLLKENAKGGSLMKEVFSLLTLELWHREFVDKSLAVSC